jgi:hypothetical protein
MKIIGMKVDFNPVEFDGFGKQDGGICEEGSMIQSHEYFLRKLIVCNIRVHLYYSIVEVVDL